MVLKHELPSGGPAKIAKQVAHDAVAKTYNVAGWTVAALAIAAVGVYLHKRGWLPQLPGVPNMAGALTDDLGTRLG